MWDSADSLPGISPTDSNEEPPSSSFRAEPFLALSEDPVANMGETMQDILHDELYFADANALQSYRMSTKKSFRFLYLMCDTGGDAVR